MKVYLAGPINACDDVEASSWRDHLKAELKYDVDIVFIDPMARDFRGIEGNHMDGIVEGDLRDIQSADIVVANTWKPSFGTAMEVFYAKSIGKHVIVLHPEGSVSPWLRYFSNQITHTVKDLQTAIQSRLMYYS